MPSYYWYHCDKCDYRAERYCNVRRCKCGGNLIREDSPAGPTCITCQYFNFKVDGGTVSYGECLNEDVRAAQHISVGAFIGDRSTREAIANFARIYYKEDSFGCRFHELEKARWAGQI